MNNAKPPFNNLNARKAFAHAFNYMGFINDILGGYATRDGLPMPDTLWGCPKNVAVYNYDLPGANELQAQSDPNLNDRHIPSRRWQRHMRTGSMQRPGDQCVRDVLHTGVILCSLLRTQ